MMRYFLINYIPSGIYKKENSSFRTSGKKGEKNGFL